MEALNADPLVDEIVVIRDVSPLWAAAAATHDQFAAWSGRFEFVISVDADVIPFPSFGEWFRQVIERFPPPGFTRWLPPLLDWVVQGRWRTAGGMFGYCSKDSADLADRFRRVADAVEPEHNYDVFALRGAEWRPELVQRGELACIHGYGQRWTEYFYRGIVHPLRKKNWLRPGVLLAADEGRAEHLVFLEGLKWALRNPNVFVVEDASIRRSAAFSAAYQEACARLGFSPSERPTDCRYADAISEIVSNLPREMYPITPNEFELC